MVHRARISATELCRVTLIAVVLTARGFGTLGFLARDIVYHDKSERCVSRETQIWKPNAKLQHRRVSGIFLFILTFPR